jgi:uncharacterized protein DUF3857
MRLTALYLIVSLFLVTPKLFSQTSLPQFGSYSADEIAMTQCSFDKDASAVILLDEAFSDFDDEWQLITKRRIRIKILNGKGLDQGTVSIPFYSKDKFEYIRNIEGITYNNPSQAVSVLDRKSIYTEKIDDRMSRVKFAMPNVRSGSIVEYKYESVMKSYGGLDRWIFQSDIPTIRSCYLLQIIPNHEFSYVVTKKPNYHIVITPKPDLGQIYFEMNEIPGLRFEPYMDAPKDYFQQVEFQLSGYEAYGRKQTVNATWRDMCSDLSSEKELGGAVKKDLPRLDELKATVEKELGLEEKMNTIYHFVRNNFTWNGIDSKYALDGLKKVWEKKNGTSGEINLLLVSLLQTFDIDASPMLVAERDFGKVNPSIPLLDRFNKTVAYVNVGDKHFILDATQKFCPPGLTPYALLNTYALPVSKKITDVINIKSTDNAYFSVATVQAKLDNAGLLSGHCSIKTNQYAKQVQSEEIAADKGGFIKKYEEENSGISIDSFQVDNMDNDAEPLIQDIDFTNQLNKTDAFVLLNYNVFTSLTKNPFTKDERFTNVDFGYPYHVTVEQTIDLPENSKVEELPANKKLVTPDRNISLTRDIRQAGNKLTIKIEFVQTVTLIPNQDYPELQNFYKVMVNTLNEPIAIKLSN